MVCFNVLRWGTTCPGFSRTTPPPLPPPVVAALPVEVAVGGRAWPGPPVGAATTTREGLPMNHMNINMNHMNINMNHMNINMNHMNINMNRAPRARDCPFSRVGVVVVVVVVVMAAETREARGGA